MPSFTFLPNNAVLLRCVRCSSRYFVVPKPDPQAVTCDHCARELSAKYEEARDLAKAYRKDLILSLGAMALFACLLLWKLL